MTGFRNLIIRGHVAAAMLSAIVPLGSAAATADAASNAQVPMRAIVQSRFHEDGGTRLYARLRLQLPGHLPFTTLTYRVPDRAVWTGLRERSRVEFSASRIQGENTITAIREASP